MVLEMEFGSPEYLESIIKMQERRDDLRLINTNCPGCNTRQIQLIDPRIPFYKCRECRHSWIGKEPE